jgi:hypothetical protein
MANNSFKAGVLMITLLLFTSLNTFSQNISKYYSSMMQPDGTLYFIFEHEGFNNKVADLKYDLTYLTSGDSITMNFSVLSKDVIEVDSIQLLNDSTSLKIPANRIFIQPAKNKWHSRYGTKFLFKDAVTFFSKENPKIILVTKNKSSELSINPGKWKKQSEIIQKIFDLINYNR